MKYGHLILWRDFWGEETSVCVSGFDTPEEAYEAALRNARTAGYTFPRWWQWWRWREPR